MVVMNEDGKSNGMLFYILHEGYGWNLHALAFVNWFISIWRSLMEGQEITSSAKELQGSD